MGAHRFSITGILAVFPMRAMDVMTTNVITVDANTSVQEVARLLSERGISGVPVVDPADRLVGIVSEGDLLHRVETGTERVSSRRRSLWLDTIASDRELARDYVKSHGRAAKDVMTREVVSVTEKTDLAEIAMLLETKRIKRVPVLRDGKLVGIVSRANLVRALAVTKSDQAVDVLKDDRAIRAKLLAELMGQEWFKTQDWFKIWAADVIVRDRVVHFWLAANQSKRRDRPCVSPPRTLLACGGSRSTSYHRLRRSQSHRPGLVSFRASPGKRLPR